MLVVLMLSKVPNQLDLPIYFIWTPRISKIVEVWTIRESFIFYTYFTGGKIYILIKLVGYKVLFIKTGRCSNEHHPTTRAFIVDV